MQKEQKITTAFLQETSEKTGLAFSKLLGAVVLEEVVRLMCESEYSKEFWLRNGNKLGKKNYERNLDLGLEYDYVIQKSREDLDGLTPIELLRDITIHLKEEVFEKQRENGVSIKAQMKAYPKYTKLECACQIEDMQVPITVSFHYIQDEKAVPKKETFSLLAFPEKEVTYYCPQAESILAEKYMEIISKLELIQNLKVYHDVYTLLNYENLDGRKVRDYIFELCDIKKIPKDNSRMEIVKSYKNYTYMKKKWKVFLRSIHSSEPGWEQVMQRFINFYDPIWKAVIEDFIFFGDWMPELNRFL